MLSTNSTPPDLPLPPAWTCAFTTHLSTFRDKAIFSASWLEEAGKPSETDMS